MRSFSHIQEMSPVDKSPSGTGWYLEGSVDGAASPTRFRLTEFPIRIGRRASLDIVLLGSEVSSLHAEIFERDGRLWVRDMGSMNGTRLNQELLADAALLSDDDILHFASLEFVLERVGEEAPLERPTALLAPRSGRLVQGARSQAVTLRQMIDSARVQVVFQPIVKLSDGTQPAFEVLGRGAHGGLPQSPGPLFEIAQSAGLAAPLSALFRQAGAAAAVGLAGAPGIFFNTHPSEVIQPGFLASLEAMGEQHPSLSAVLEVHETTVTDPRSMRELRAALTALGIGLAFDDFGAGQSRLLELAESPPDYLKFDIHLIHDIHNAPASRQSMVENLVSIVRDMGVYCLAEGIECQEELDTCVQMGFEFGQGYLLGRPQPAQAWQSTDE
jgi:EAL domain-containing protein (putative c-di-GMP-specific phosphodiesterase class I)